MTVTESARTPQPNQPGNHKGDRYHELGLRDFLRRCAMNFKSLEDCLPTSLVSAN